MLNAIDTFKHHGKVDPVSARTLSLIERGLLQIKDTVAALLVEAQGREPSADAPGHRGHAHAGPGRRPAQAGAASTGRTTSSRTPAAALHAGAPDPDQPAAQRRAAPSRSGGGMSCRVDRDSGSAAHRRVATTAPTFPPERMQYLFEPFAPGSGREAATAWASG
ncbi:MAG: hypothetical protein MZW92_46630 [Comamonadaceae bacterium]|nr:hypothetical protein [Comamonadaceae bacterium]